MSTRPHTHFPYTALARCGEECGPRRPCGTGAARSEVGTLGLVELGAPALPDALHVVKQAACVQMIAPHLSVPETGFHVVPLGDADAAAMHDLATLPEPGPFFERTHVLGGFGGVRERSEESRVGQAGFSTCRFRWSQYHSKQKTHH